MTQNMTSMLATRGRSFGRAGRIRGLGLSGQVALGVVLLAALIAVVGPMLATDDPLTIDLLSTFGGPTGGHLLGFDIQGRDVVSRLLVGARSSMIGPLMVVVLAMSAGTALAIAAAWRRGRVDAFISSGMDVVFAFPGILLAVLSVTIFGAGLIAAVVALSIAYTPYVARVMRAAALKERTLPYVEALQVQGASGLWICARHVIPNMVPYLVAQTTILFGYAMVDLAAISYLGLGVQIPKPDWGLMISENQSGIADGHTLPSLAAGLCIVVVVVAFNVLGDRLFSRAERIKR